jgi:uncharacterized protein YbbK (DUF523 family)/N-acetylglutamate synthase-like GNAT family acetyltransferase
MELVSACLVGVACRYNGERRTDGVLAARFSRGDLLPLCPELLGGLCLPRPPSEIRGGTGASVLEDRSRVVNREGEDLTDAFLRGAEACLRLAKSVGASQAYLAARSPSCGSGSVYDGSFSGRLVAGDGVAAALLKRNGIEVHCVERIASDHAKAKEAPGSAPAIRGALSSDAEGIARLSEQLGYPCTVAELGPKLEKHLSGDKTVIVAESKGEILGWASLELVDRLYIESHAEITAFVVDERCRGRGIGSLIMEEALRWAASKGLRLIRLKSNVLRKDAHRFYESRGFARTKESYTFEKRID